jgi:WD40 repeat protein
VNITTHLFVSDLNVSAFWMPDGQLFTVCYNGVSSTTNAFCVIDPHTQTAIWYAPLAPNMAGYRILNGAYLSSSGKELLVIVIPEKAARSAIPELRRLDFNGHLGPELLPLQSPYLQIAISPSDSFVSYAIPDEGRLGFVDIQSGKAFLVLDDSSAWSITWIGWVR